MGLDMYLTKRVYVGQQYPHRKIRGRMTIEADGKKIAGGLRNVREIVYDVGYWRKANQIHQWFVNNVQGGKDECQESYVELDQLRELDSLCEQVLADHTLAPKLLPTQSGFFFGGTDYDEWYFKDLEHTREILAELFANADPENPWIDYYYESSW